MRIRTGIALTCVILATSGCVGGSPDPMPGDQAEDACKKRVEAEYVPDQLPLTFGQVSVELVDAVRIVTGSVEGNTTNPTRYYFTCVGTTDGETRLVSFDY